MDADVGRIGVPRTPRHVRIMSGFSQFPNEVETARILASQSRAGRRQRNASEYQLAEMLLVYTWYADCSKASKFAKQNIVKQVNLASQDTRPVLLSSTTFTYRHSYRTQ